jgi:hypothetical protein
MSQKKAELFDFNQAEELVRNWLIAKYFDSVLDPCAYVIDDTEYQVSFARFADFTNYLLSQKANILNVLSECALRRWTINYVLDVNQAKLEESSFLQLLSSSLQLRMGRNQFLGVTTKIFDQTEPQKAQRTSNAQREPYLTLARLQSEGNSIKDVLELFQSPEYRQLHELCQNELAQSPMIRRKNNGKPRRRVLRDLVEAAFSHKYYSRKVTSKPTQPMLFWIDWAPPTSSLSESTKDLELSTAKSSLSVDSECGVIPMSGNVLLEKLQSGEF